VKAAASTAAVEASASAAMSSATGSGHNDILLQKNFVYPLYTIFRRISTKKIPFRAFS
jgi:hypothetical protein